MGEDILQRHLSKSTFSLVYKSKNLYVMGKYLKFTRFMSQTPWEVEGERLVG